MPTPQPAILDVEALRAGFRGALVGPADSDYDAARTVVLGGIDRRPAVIVRVADTDDVRAAIALARDTRPRDRRPIGRPQRCRARRGRRRCRDRRP